MSETNNNFQQLKQLLKLKRHEMPPPGYFNHFSGDVISRLRAGEASQPESLIERIQSESSLLAFLLPIFQARPGIIGALATSLCLLLLIGVVWADRPDATSGDMSAAQPSQASPQTDPTLASVVPAAVPLEPAENSGIAVSTNPVTSLQPVASLFGSSQNPLFQSAAFMPAGQ
jgi:hypothetical protein